MYHSTSQVPRPKSHVPRPTHHPSPPPPMPSMPKCRTGVTFVLALGTLARDSPHYWVGCLASRQQLRATASSNLELGAPETPSTPPRRYLRTYLRTYAAHCKVHMRAVPEVPMRLTTSGKLNDAFNQLPPLGTAEHVPPLAASLLPWMDRWMDGRTDGLHSTPRALNVAA